MNTASEGCVPSAAATGRDDQEQRQQNEAGGRKSSRDHRSPSAA
jgi:hypothetical protein